VQELFLSAHCSLCASLSANALSGYSATKQDKRCIWIFNRHIRKKKPFIFHVMPLNNQRHAAQSSIRRHHSQFLGKSINSPYFMEPEVRYRVHHSPPLAPVPSYMNPANALTTHFSQFIVMILPSKPRSFKWSISFRFLPKPCKKLSFLPFVPPV
jgi:hypothetical protein